jgi:hypothetical protein
MKQKFIKVVAISPEPGAITALRRERKMPPPNDLRNTPHHFFGIYSDILIYEPPVAY